MKTIKYISFIAFLFIALTSCDKDDDQVVYNSENAKSGTLNAIKDTYELKSENAAKTMETFRWSLSDFDYAASVTYTVQLDIAGKNFENAQDLLAVISSDTSTVTVEAVNKAMLELQKIYEFPDDTWQDVELRLQSSISKAADPLYSNVITSNIKPYLALPKNMYMIGQDFGEWNWNSTGVVEMVPVHSVEGAFWCINYFSAANGFKWSPLKDWDKSFSSLNKNVGFTVQDGNAVLAADGLYMVYIDMRKGEITIEPAKIYGIGDAFGGWDADVHPFTVNGKTASIITAVAGNLRMYTKPSVSASDWWTREFNIIEGKITYRGAGEELAAVSVAAGKTVTLDFKAGTGTIE